MKVRHHGASIRLRGVIVRDPTDPTAPGDPEYRERLIAAAPVITREEMARQLAADPEFREWAAAERRGAMFAGHVK